MVRWKDGKGSNSHWGDVLWTPSKNLGFILGTLKDWGGNWLGLGEPQCLFGKPGDEFKGHYGVQLFGCSGVLAVGTRVVPYELVRFETRWLAFPLWWSVDIWLNVAPECWMTVVLQGLTNGIFLCQEGRNLTTMGPRSLISISHVMWKRDGSWRDSSEWGHSLGSSSCSLRLRAAAHFPNPMWQAELFCYHMMLVLFLQPLNQIVPQTT